MTTLDMFSATGIKPRRPPRVMMRVLDAGHDGAGRHAIEFKCRKCGYETGWVRSDESISEIKRGRPCPECN
ncbi:hypothetical protein [uncultured Microbulbifer sp.]|uniref:hypothetical protein n=1 Tax=uncultured Microbulbifer sp. TaxID=348147 RepID=UPI0026205FEE|nr:hypothetical protein [uncultured Microbulbifer sp.]